MLTISLGWPAPNTTSTHHLQIRLPPNYPHPLQVQYFHQLTTPSLHSEYTHPLQVRHHQSSLSLSRGEGVLERCIDSMGHRGSCTQSAAQDDDDKMTSTITSSVLICCNTTTATALYKWYPVPSDLQSLTLMVTCYSNIVDRFAAFSEGPASSPMQQHTGGVHNEVLEQSLSSYTQHTIIIPNHW